MTVAAFSRTLMAWAERSSSEPNFRASTPVTSSKMKRDR